MVQSDFEAAGNDPRAQKVVRAVERFLTALRKRAPRRHASRVVHSGTVLQGKKVRQSPERFIVEHLVTDVADALGYDYRPQPKGIAGLGGRIPDFEVLNADGVVIGEVKKPNQIEEARDEAFQYLGDISGRPAAGIATDGWTWVLHTSSKRGSEPIYDCHRPLRPVMKRIWTEKYERSERASRLKLREEAQEFVSELSIEALDKKNQMGE
ncbi:hypothetical protein [Halolamina rubra]|uniref:hypothetical protein n=1 Tax=Halolamina rubra TaxID=1380430 RepID=UPI0012AC10C8|nr:hypothetical protein [Halolamina rubra]